MGIEALKIGFIGAGNMGGALAKAAAKTAAPANIMIADKFEDKAIALANELGAKFSDNVEIAEKCDFIFLGVKPQMMAEMLAEIKPCLAERSGYTLVSMMAGVKTEKICETLGFSAPIIRIMPNTAVEVGEGMVLYTANEAASDSAERDFLAFMAKAGEFEKLPEHLIDAGTAVSGCGPAYVYMFIEALADGGVKCGLPRATALKLAEQTLLGAAKLAKETGRHPEELKDAVCSPAGSTIEGCFALEKGGFRAATIGAVNAAYERTQGLGK
ncbi:MAG: pyrroline-5-carboxylate reductase [Clostridia bacterium]|nr:pyrroline-5-carboxylate reductase [Clostridia bacterium]